MMGGISGVLGWQARAQTASRKNVTHFVNVNSNRSIDSGYTEHPPVIFAIVLGSQYSAALDHKCQCGAMDHTLCGSDSDVNISWDCNEILFIVTQHRTLLQHQWAEYQGRCLHRECHTQPPISGLRSAGSLRVEARVSQKTQGDLRHWPVHYGPVFGQPEPPLRGNYNDRLGEGRARLLVGNLISGVNTGHRAQRVERRERAGTQCLLDIFQERTKTTDSSV